MEVLIDTLDSSNSSNSSHCATAAVDVVESVRKRRADVRKAIEARVPVRVRRRQSAKAARNAALRSLFGRIACTCCCVLCCLLSRASAAEERFVLPGLSDLGLDESGRPLGGELFRKEAPVKTAGTDDALPLPGVDASSGGPGGAPLADPGFQGRRPLEGFRQLWPGSRRTPADGSASLNAPRQPPPSPGFGGLYGGPLKIYVEHFLFEGNTEGIISDAELAGVVAGVTNREIGTEDLEAARVAVTKHYINKGFINSGAVLPDQSVDDATVTLNIVEGTLTDIRIDGNRWVRDGFFERRIRLGADTPLNIYDLQEPLLLLHRNPNVRRLAAELKPDVNPGESYLQVDVTENPPLRAGIDFNNSRPPSVGEEQIEAWMSHSSITGNGDRLEFRYGMLDRGLDDVRHEGFRNFAAFYTLPVTRHDTTLFASYQRNSYTVIEEPFQNLDIDGESSTWRVGLRHPWRWLPRNYGENYPDEAMRGQSSEFEHEFALGLYFDRERSETSLLGVPFSINAGAVNGETEISVLRVTQEWTSRSSNQVLALRATESFGVDAFNVTNGPTERDGEFFSLLGQAQYVRKLGDTNTQMIVRGSMQWTNDPLLSLEQFSIGGMYTVRGYRENQVVRDVGYLGSVEFRIPVIPSKRQGALLTVAPFVDVGGGWNNELAGGLAGSDDHETIVSAGVGLLFQPTECIHAELYWGHGFTDFGSAEDSLQDSGFHFRVSIGKF